MKLLRVLVGFLYALMLLDLNATPTFAIRDDGALTSVEMHGESEAVIPDGVTAIWDCAFRNCYSLTSVVIPASVTRICGWAFEGCSHLASITFLGAQPQTSGENFRDISVNCVFRIPRNIPYNVNDRWYGFAVERYDPGDVPYVVSSVRWTINNGELARVELNGETDITIPSFVTSIGGGAFSSCSHELKSVVIPDSVETIRANAFADCRELTSVVIGRGVKHIDSSAFRGCESLRSVVFLGNALPDCGDDVFANVANGCVAYVDRFTYGLCDDERWNGVMVVRVPSLCDLDVHSQPTFTVEHGELTRVDLNDSRVAVIPGSVTRIRSDAFRGCYGLKVVIMGGTVEEIENGVFENCHELACVVLGIGLTTIGDWAFSGCHDLTSIILPDSVRRIGANAFSNCSRLLKVSIPDSVAYIGESAFCGCIGLTNISVGVGNAIYSSANGLLLSKDGNLLIQGVNGNVIIPHGVESVGQRAFYGCGDLTSVTLPDTVATIFAGAFENCYSLTGVSLPDGLTIIGDDAFSGCRSLTSMTIPSGVRSIGRNVFSGCNGVAEFSVVPDNVHYMSREGLLLTKDGKTLVCGVNVSGCVMIPEGVISIEESAFSNCRALTSATIPISAMNIGNRTFFGCDGMTNVTLGGGVTNIGDYAFCNCSLLESVTIPDNVVNIGDHAFSECSALSAVTIGSGLTGIGASAFSYCSSLTEVVIPDNVTDIKAEAFSCCGLVSVTVGKGVKIVGPWFSGCSGLTNVTMHDGVTEIWSDAFAGRSALKNMVIPNSVMNIGDYTFYQCTGLTNLVIGNSVTNIGECSFFNCCGLTNVTIPDGVASIGRCAFQDCSNLSLALLPARLNGNISSGNLFRNCAPDLRIMFYEGRVEDIEWIAVSFDANGGEVVPSRVNTIKGIAIGGMPTPTRSRYQFLGWFFDAKDGEEVTEETVLYENITLRAHWEPLDKTIYCQNGVRLMVSGGELQGIALCGASELEIPECVTSISSNLFSYEERRELTSVIIPDSVTNIGEYAFYDCRNLETVTIGCGVMNIGRGAFEWCGNIKSIVVPQYVCNGRLSRIFPDAYGSITNAVIADGVTSIGDGAFWGCGLTCVTIPNSVTSIGSSAFGGCGNLSFALVPSRLNDNVSQVNPFRFCASCLQVVYYDEDDWINVCFDANGGEVPQSLANALKGHVRGCSMGNLPIPSRIEHLFLGWFTEAECGEQVTEETVVTESVTLYAHWEPMVVYKWVYAIVGSGDSGAMSVVVDGSTNTSSVIAVPQSAEGVFTTDITFLVKDGFEIYSLTTNGVQVTEATGKREAWTFKLTSTDRLPVTVFAIPRPIIPNVPTDATREIVVAALEGSADAMLSVHITDAETYGAYRDWAMKIGATDVKASPFAWASFATDSAALLAKMPTDGDLKVEEFKPSGTAGSFDFTVSVKDVTIGDKASVDNLKKLFGLEGAESLDSAAFSSENVALDFKEPQDGKLKFTATPAVDNAKSFFMKVKVK